MTKVFSSINAELRKAPDYDKRYDAVIATRDHNRATKFILSRAKPVLANIVKRVKSEYIIGASPRPAPRPGATRTANGNTTQPSGVIQKRILGEQVDWHKTSRADYLAGRAIGLDGKSYRWK